MTPIQNLNSSESPLFTEQDIRSTKIYHNRLGYYEEHLLSNQRYATIKLLTCMLVSILVIVFSMYMMLLTVNIILYSLFMVLCLSLLAWLCTIGINRPENTKHNPRIPHLDDTTLVYQGYVLVLNHEESEVNIFKLKEDGLRLNSVPIYSKSLNHNKMNKLEDEVNLVIEHPYTPSNLLPLLSKFIDKTLINEDEYEIISVRPKQN